MDHNIDIEIEDDKVKEYVGDNYQPQDVFIDEYIIEYVRSNFDPDDVFPESELDTWAENNEYVKESTHDQA